MRERVGRPRTEVPTTEAVPMARHQAVVTVLAAQVAGAPPGLRVRLAKATTNLFRPRARPDPQVVRLDVSGLGGVLEVDPVARTATVQGMATYERVVAATLAHGFMPTVVPQLRTITVGGAVTGLGIESSSFRAGLPHESVRSLDILTGTGDVLTVAPGGEHDELFRAFPNSYGTLGYAVRLTIALAPVRPYVRLRHIGFRQLPALVEAVGEICATGAYAGSAVDFVDGVVFARDAAYLVLGAWEDRIDAAERPSDYAGQRIYYRSIRERATDVLTVADYLWRWDTDWFWCSRAFGAQYPLVRRLWPRRWRRSDVYQRLVGLEHRWHPAARVDRWRGRPPRERVVQDVEIPLERTADFLDWFLREVPIEPIWLCPIIVGQRWPLYPMAPGRPYVNVGFWSSVPIRPGGRDGEVNRLIEQVVAQHGGHKSLYSDAYYSRNDFDAAYGGPDYALLKARYDPLGRFPDLYDKVVRRR